MISAEIQRKAHASSERLGLHGLASSKHSMHVAKARSRLHERRLLQLVDIFHGEDLNYEGSKAENGVFQGSGVNVRAGEL